MSVRHLRHAGFTLMEVLISTTISSIIMVALLTTFLMMGRSGANARNYTGMEADARKGLERFGEDVRMAKTIAWTSSTNITLTLSHPNDNNTDTVIYSWDNTPNSSTYQCLLRNGPDPVTGVTSTQALIHNVKVFEFNRWMLGTSGAATNDLGTDQLQIRLTLRQQSVTAATASNLVVSARFVMRNKRTTAT